jgi:DMSO/TMAO reductase YedYZ molybdopterin-dependent catalytic subunit
MNACETEAGEKEGPEGPDPLAVFPTFTSPNDMYIDTRIGLIPSIDADDYRLSISGAIKNPGLFSLADLYKLEQKKITLTTECIGNSSNGPLVATAEWRGFSLYDFLDTLGIADSATIVKYISDDGYFTYNTLEELRTGDVMGALYMNDEPLPERYGFPLRVIFPGYYGVRHPGWVTAIEVKGSGPEDFWSGAGWKSDSAMTIDSKIFFPLNRTQYTLGDTVKIGGAAFGARRIASVEVSPDDEASWIPTTIRSSLDHDHVWVFWECTFVPETAGSFTLRSRATDSDGNIQVKVDRTPADGVNSWPSVEIEVK